MGYSSLYRKTFLYKVVRFSYIIYVIQKSDFDHDFRNFRLLDKIWPKLSGKIFAQKKNSWSSKKQERIMLKNGWYNSILVFQKKMMFKNMIFKIMIFWGITESPRFFAQINRPLCSYPVFWFPTENEKNRKRGKRKRKIFDIYAPPKNIHSHGILRKWIRDVSFYWTYRNT